MKTKSLKKYLDKRLSVLDKIELYFYFLPLRIQLFSKGRVLEIIRTLGVLVLIGVQITLLIHFLGV